MALKKSAPKSATKNTTGTKGSKPRTKSTDVAVLVPVNLALKAAWDKQTSIIKIASRRDASAWDEKYEAVAAIVSHDPPLYLAGGFATFDGFVKEYLHEDARQVRDWIAVALNASPDEEAQYTVTRLALLLSLLRVQSKDGTLPKKIDWKKLRVSVKDEKGKVTQREAVEMSLDEIRQARRMWRTSSVGNHARDGAEVQAVRGEFKSAVLKAITVQYKDGKFWFGAVPGYALREFLKAVGDAKWETADDTVEPTVPTKKAKKVAAPVTKSKGKGKTAKR